MSAALAVTHQLRRGTGGVQRSLQFAVACGDVQDCGTVATTPTAAPAAATLLAAAQVAPYSPMYNPLYGMEACGAGYKYRYRTPERTIRHVPAHVPNFRTMSFLFLDQSCRFSPGSAARRTRLMRDRYTSKHVVMSSRLPGSLAFVLRQIPDLPPLKMRGPRAAEYNCTGRSVILGVCPRLSQPFAVKTVSTESPHFGGNFGFVNRFVSPWRGLSLTLVQCARNQACVDKGSTFRAPRRSTVGAYG